MNTKNILLTGGRAPVTLHLARMLNNKGHNVYVAESEAIHLCQKSNVVKGNFLVPKPNENQQNYVDKLIQLCKENSIGLLIPTCEEIFHIAKLRELFTVNNIHVFCTTIDILRLLHNKFTFNQYLNDNNYISPKTIKVSTREELDKGLKHFNNQKIVLKKVFSRFASDVYILNSSDILPSITISEKEPWIIQEFINGTQYCSYSVAQNGKLNAHTCYPTIYTAGLGANVYFQHVEVPSIQLFVERIVKELNFTGQIAFDFIKDDKGNYYPIECNPRSTSGLHLFDDTDDFSNLFFQSIEELLKPNGEWTYKLGIPMFLYGFSNRFLSRNFLRDFLMAKDVIYSTKDKIPYFYQGKIFLHLLSRKIKSRKKLSELTTEDIEWSGN